MIKRILGTITASGVVLYLASGIAKAGNYIDIDASTTASMLAYIGEIFTDVKLLVVLCIGLPVGFWFITKVISMVRGGFRTSNRR